MRENREQNYWEVKAQEIRSWPPEQFLAELEKIENGKAENIGSGDDEYEKYENLELFTFGCATDVQLLALVQVKLKQESEPNLENTEKIIKEIWEKRDRGVQTFGFPYGIKTFDADTLVQTAERAREIFLTHKELEEGSREVVDFNRDYNPKD